MWESSSVTTTTLSLLSLKPLSHWPKTSWNQLTIITGWQWERLTDLRQSTRQATRVQMALMGSAVIGSQWDSQTPVEALIYVMTLSVCRSLSIIQLFIRCKYLVFPTLLMFYSLMNIMFPLFALYCCCKDANWLSRAQHTITPPTSGLAGVLQVLVASLLLPDL